MPNSVSLKTRNGPPMLNVTGETDIVDSLEQQAEESNRLSQGIGDTSVVDELDSIYGGKGLMSGAQLSSAGPERRDIMGARPPLDLPPASLDESTPVMSGPSMRAAAPSEQRGTMSKIGDVLKNAYTGKYKRDISEAIADPVAAAIYGALRGFTYPIPQSLELATGKTEQPAIAKENPLSTAAGEMAGFAGNRIIGPVFGAAVRGISGLLIPAKTLIESTKVLTNTELAGEVLKRIVSLATPMAGMEILEKARQGQPVEQIIQEAPETLRTAMLISSIFGNVGAFLENLGPVGERIIGRTKVKDWLPYEEPFETMSEAGKVAALTDRWRELRNIGRKRSLTPQEKAEFDDLYIFILEARNVGESGIRPSGPTRKLLPPPAEAGGAPSKPKGPTPKTPSGPTVATPTVEVVTPKAPEVPNIDVVKPNKPKPIVIDVVAESPGSAAQRFAEGEKVKWTDKDGTEKTGIFRSSYGDHVTVLADEYASPAGVPIRHVLSIDPRKLMKIVEEPTEEPKAPEAPSAPAPEPPAEVETPTAEATDPHHVLTTKVKEALARGESFDNRALDAMATEAFGGTRGEGKYTPRDAYDAFEAGMNQHIKEAGLVDYNDPEGTIDRLDNLTKQLVRQTDRTERQVELQQFSTPPSEAFVASYAAGLKPGMTGMEPSAGTANIAIMMDATGAKVITNEIDPLRAKLLKQQGFEVTMLDGEQLNNLLPDNVKIDVFVMNPPFSATGGRVKQHDTMFGVRHVEQALARVKEGGRVVAIVGRGMAHDMPNFSEWWDKIEKKYNVRANIGISGKYYGKMGTGFDNQILLIDKTGPTPGANRAERIGSIIRADGLSPKEALMLIGSLAKEDVYGRIYGRTKGPGAVTAGRDVQQPSGQERKPNTGVGELRGGEGRTPAGVRGRTGRNAVEGVVGDQPSGQGLGRQGTGELGPGEQKGTPERQRPTPDEGVGPRPNAGLPGREQSGEAPQSAVKSSQAEVDEGTYSSYVVQKSVFPDAKSPVSKIVETSSMAAVEPPDPTYTPDLPPEVVSEGRLDAVQLERVVYAGQRHSQLLSDGKRAGSLVADGTGTGKGRVIAAIVLDNFNHGRKKAVWISYTKGLVFDAKRDLDALGVPMDVIPQHNFKSDGKIENESGILFTTYSLLRQDWGKNKPRLKQLLDWLGPDYDGFIAFDESHMMKGLAGTTQGGTVSTKEGSQQGHMGHELQQTLAKARISYFSATNATVPRNMAYMERLGLWGPGAPFSDFISFLTAMERGGLGSMEMLAWNLKQMGAMQGCSLSFEGTKHDPTPVEYAVLKHSLTPDEEANYNQAADIWSNLLQAFGEAAKNTNAAKSAKGKGSIFNEFYSAQQRFFMQLMTGIKLPEMLDNADKDLAEGRSVVFSICTTGESQLKQRAKSFKEAARSDADQEESEEFSVSPKELIANLIKRHFPTIEYIAVTDDATGKTTYVASDPPIINKENVQKQQELLDGLSELHIPENPLDTIINRWGPDSIAEITGRKQRIVKGKIVNRKLKGVPTKYLNTKEAELFNLGKKRVAVISPAGDTGISLHSGENFKNQERRAFYMIEPPWSADKAMQSMGRVQRKGQINQPRIYLTRTDIASEARKLSALQKRMASLGAQSRGSREALGGGIFTTEDITGKYGQVALGSTYDSLRLNEIEGLSRDGFNILRDMDMLDAKGNIKNGADENVEGFLNRIMVLHVSDQNKLFKHFHDQFDRAINRAIEAGEYDTGVKKLKGKNLRETAEYEVIYTDPNTKAETGIATITGELPVRKRDISRADDLVKGGGRYVRNVRSGKIYIAKSDSGVGYGYGGKIRLFSPKEESDHSVEYYEINDTDKYEELGDGEGAKIWKDEHDALPASKEQTTHLVTGAVFPIYDVLSGGENAPLSGANLAIYQAKTPKKTYLGYRIHESAIPQLKQRLGIGAPLGEMSGEDIYRLVDSGSVIELNNGWQLRQTRIHGEQRIELLPSSVRITNEEAEALGVFHEIIKFDKRYFVPHDKDSGGAVISNIIAKHKAVKDLTAGAESPQKARLRGRSGQAGFLALGPKPKPPERPYQVKDPDIQDFFQRTGEARKLYPSLRERLGRAVQAMTRSLPDLPDDPLYSRAREIIRQLKQVNPVSEHRAIERLVTITEKLNKSQLDTLRYYTLLQDLLETAADNKLLVPEGLTEDGMRTEIEHLEKFIQADPLLSMAVKTHYVVMGEIQESLINMGLLSPEVADKHKRYIPHHVIEYLEAAKQPGGKGVGRKLSEPYRAYLRERKGSLKDISTNYLQLLFDHISKVEADNLRAEAIENIQKAYGFKQEKVEKDDGTFEMKLVPTGTEVKGLSEDQIALLNVTEWQPKEGNIVYLATSIPERMIAELMEQIALDPNMARELNIPLEATREILAVGRKRRTLLIPKVLANQLDNMPIRKPAGFLRRAMGAWKSFMLMSRPVRYNLNNLAGDSERAWMSLPGALNPDNLRGAAKELLASKGGKMVPGVEDAFNRSAIDTGFSAVEMEQRRVELHPEFKLFRKPGLSKVMAALKGKTWGRLWELTTARENFLRYALYRYNVERFKAGKGIDFGSYVNPEEAMRKGDYRDQAAYVSRESMLDYGDISESGQKIRESLIPFYSWMEGNTKFWTRIFFSPKIGGKAKLGAGAAKAATLLLRLAGMYGSVWLYNNLVRGDLEKDLTPDDRRQPHINLYRDANGHVIRVSFQTALSDFAEWFGYDQTDPLTRRLLAGRISGKEWALGVAKEIGKGVSNKVVQSLTPYYKFPTEGLIGKSLYPDAFHPKTILNGERLQYAIRGIFGSTIERAADITGFIEGRPSHGKVGKGQSFAEYMLALSRTDPQVSNYYNAVGQAVEFAQKKGRFGEGQGENTLLFRRFKQSVIMQNDAEATRYAREITDKGLLKNVRASMQYFDPMRFIPKNIQQEFRDSMTEEEAAAFMAGVMRGKELESKALSYFGPVQQGGTRGPARGRGRLDGGGGRSSGRGKGRLSDTRRVSELLRNA